ncbi:MAG: hypothetical protein M1833_001248 [Piccolia ochrophora]|nr:MAG: hypothetical protein M1833_001248 [Piccolia ochrophora]
MARPRRESRGAGGVERPPGAPPRRHHQRRQSSAAENPQPSPRAARDRVHRTPHRDRDPEKTRSTNSTSHLLSEDSLAKLNATNVRSAGPKDREKAALKPQKQRVEKREKKHHHQHHQHRRKRRVVSGPALEAQRGSGRRRVEGDRKKKRKIWIGVIAVVLLLIIIIPIGVLVVGKKNGSSSGNGSTSNVPAPDNTELESIDASSIPQSAKGSELDPFSWYDTGDFNVTYTDEKVGGLPLMGLFSTWDDKTRANGDVPPLDQEWKYGTRPIRGVNVGGWLSIEPFITPSLFSSYSGKDGVVDEYSLTKKLGPMNAKQTLEQHYSSFVTEQTFADIAAAGLDHVRIPYSYWAVTTYPGDPYVPRVSWRYLLRGIEWARKHGLRVNLDLHAAPGSQNGWNHSGRLGVAAWLNGTDGDLNGQRTLDVHKQLSEFFAQPRYKNVVTIYGILNEPKMLNLNPQSVRAWTDKAIGVVQGNGVAAKISVSDGFLPPDQWVGEFSSYKNVVLDSHQYQIFNQEQVAFPHQKKIQFACDGLSSWMDQVSSTSTGFGPTFCGEWSQADTDCAQFLNNVGTGSRWEGTLRLPDPKLSVLTPTCPTKNRDCSCAGANADPSDYSDTYKQWLKMFAEAQMHSYERGWGWFYWTWDTESAVHWSYKKGLAAGIMPEQAGQREFDCGDVPDFKDMSETY